MNLSPGTQLGSCEILGLIGLGGMGEVYRGRDKNLGRDVAIKALPATLAHDPDRLARFEREAQILAALSHPNLAVIHELKEVEGEKYLILELVEGYTLAERIAKGPIPLEDALDFAQQIAEGLEAAHEKGIVHRDLKPANVKITPEGRVKVLDFGLAKMYDPVSSPSNVSNSPTLSAMQTAAGVIMGTAAYMSPEQARGKTVDRRGDVWAFGCVLYEMLTGRQAFPNAETVSDTLAAILRGEPEWKALPAGTPSSIRLLLERCLRKDPRRRLPDIGAARIEIEEAAASPIHSPVPAPVVARRRFVWPAVALASVLIAALSTVLVLRRPAPDLRVVRFDVFAPDGTTIAAGHALSPDGRRLAFLAGPTGQQRIWIRQLDASTPTVIAGTEGASRIFWSPDNQSIAFFSQGQLKKVAASGGAPLVIAKEGRDAAWSKDGVILIGRTGHALLRMPAAGGPTEPATELGERETTHDYPEFLPDGRHFLYMARHGSKAEDWDVYAGSLDSKDRRLLPGIHSGVRYSESGHVIFYSGATLLAQPFDAARLELTGAAFPIADGVRGGPAHNNISISTNGTLAFSVSVSGAEAQPTWFDRSGRQLGVAGPSGEYQNLDLSPNNQHIAFDRGALLDIYIRNLKTGSTSRFTTDAAADAVPIWSPDGGTIAFLSSREPSGPAAPTNPNFGNLYERAVGVVGADKVLLKTTAGKTPTDWSRDGRYLVYVSDGDVWALPMPASSNTKPLRVTETASEETNAQVSPNGQFIAYNAAELGGQNEVYIQSFPKPGAKQQVSTNGGFFPRWSPDGTELYYFEFDAEPHLMSVSIRATAANLQASAPQRLFSVRLPGFTGYNFYEVSPGFRSYDVSFDGRFLINVTTKEQTAPITVVHNWGASLKQ